MSTQVDLISLSARLDLQTGAFVDGAKKVESQLKSMEEKFSKAGAVIKKFAIAMALEIGRRVVGSFVDSSREAAKFFVELDKGSDAFKRMQSNAEKMGFALSEVEQNNLTALDTAFKELDATIEAGWLHFQANFAPIMIGAIKLVRDAINGLAKGFEFLFYVAATSGEIATGQIKAAGESAIKGAAALKSFWEGAKDIDVSAAKAAGAGKGRGGGGGIDQSVKDMQRLSDAYTRIQEELNPLLAIYNEYEAKQKTMQELYKLSADELEKLETSHFDLAETMKLIADAGDKEAAIFQGATDWAKEANRAMKDLSSGLANTLVDGITDADASFSEFAQNFLNKIAEMILQQTIFNALFGAKGAGGLIGGIISGITGGATRASPALAGIGQMSGIGTFASPTVESFGTGGMALPSMRNDSRETQGGNVSISQNFDFRGAQDVQLLRAESERIKNETLVAVEASIRRGGSLARLVGRKQ